ncbi:hypothetical protein ACVGOW_05805 [Pseudonocardia saturnea]
MRAALAAAVAAAAVVAVSAAPALQFPDWQWIALALTASVVLPGLFAARGPIGRWTAVAAGTALAWSVAALLDGAGAPGLVQAAGAPVLALDAAAVLGALLLLPHDARSDRAGAPAARTVAVLGLLVAATAVAALGFRMGAGDGAGGVAAAAAVLVAGCPCALLLLPPPVSGPRRLVLRAAHGEGVLRAAAALHAGTVPHPPMPGRADPDARLPDARLPRAAPAEAAPPGGGPPPAPRPDIAERAATPPPAPPSRPAPSDTAPSHAAQSAEPSGDAATTDAEPLPPADTAPPDTAAPHAAVTRTADRVATEPPRAAGQAAPGERATDPDPATPRAAVDQAAADHAAHDDSHAASDRAAAHHPAAPREPTAATATRSSTPDPGLADLPFGPPDPVGRAVVAAARRRFPTLPGVSDADGVPTTGLRGVVSELTGDVVLAHAVLAGPPEWLQAHGVPPTPDAARAAARGPGPVWCVAWDGEARGWLELVDARRPGARRRRVAIAVTTAAAGLGAGAAAAGALVPAAAGAVPVGAALLVAALRMIPTPDGPRRGHPIGATSG